MSFYSDNIYRYLVDKLGDPPAIRKIRQKIIPLAQGTVLEIGAGSGANFPHVIRIKQVNAQPFDAAQAEKLLDQFLAGIR